MLKNYQINTRLIWFFLASLFLYHLPFLTADPDINISFSRDAFTDEGLYTAQLRNYLSGFGFDLNTSDNLIKSPLFSLILFLPFKLIGAELHIARLSILLITFISYFFISKDSYWRKILLIAGLTILSHYVIFQYSHYALSEMLSTSFILLGIFFISKLSVELNFRQQLKYITLACLWIALSYYSKFQFIYITPLPVLSISFIAYLKFKKNELTKRHAYKLIGLSFLISLGFVLLYSIFWYMPHKELHDYVLSYESDKRYPKENILSSIYFNFNYYTQQPGIASLAYTFIVLFLLGVYLFFRTKSIQFKSLFTITTIWILLELHKAPMLYLPTRYLVSFYFACGLCSAIVLLEIWESGLFKLNSVLVKGACLLVIIFHFSKNVNDYITVLENRTYHIQSLNAYFKNSPVKKIALGSWSASLLWGNNAFTAPVWKNYFNDRFIFKKINPNIIVSELDEEDSNQAFQSNGIDLESISDSTKHFQVGKWKGKIYWINQQKVQALN